MRLTKRNFLGNYYVPGYAPFCDDPKTCELIVILTNRLADMEDLLEQPGILDSMPPEAIDQLKKKGIL